MKILFPKISFLLVLTATLSACVQNVPETHFFDRNIESASFLSDDDPAVDLTPYLQTTSNWTCGPKRDCNTTTDGKPCLGRCSYSTLDTLTGMYARFRIVSALHETSGQGDQERADPNVSGGLTATSIRRRNYNFEERNMLKRLLWGKSFTSVLSAKARVIGSNPERSFEHIFPLATVSHDSNKEVGEVFLTDLSNTRVDEPYFRIDPGMKISFAFEYRQSTTVSSNAVNTVLDVTREATQLLSIQSTVLTELTSASAERQAKVFDKALSLLFAKSVTERVLWEHPMRDWPGEDNAVAVRFDMPRTGFGSNTENVGTWQVVISCPKPSIFSDWQFCPPPATSGSEPDSASNSEDGTRYQSNCRYCVSNIKQARYLAFHDLNPFKVLTTKLSETTNIRDHLRSQEWFSEGVAAIKAGGEGENETLTERFCARSKSEMVRLGLNRFDATVVLHSIMNGMDFTGKERRMMAGACVESLNPVSLDVDIPT